MQSGSVPWLEDASPRLDSLCASSRRVTLLLCTPQFKREDWSLPDPFQCWRRPPPPGAMGKGGENSHTGHESYSRRHAGGVLWWQRRGCPIRLWGKGYN